MRSCVRVTMAGLGGAPLVLWASMSRVLADSPAPSLLTPISAAPTPTLAASAGSDLILAQASADVARLLAIVGVVLVGVSFVLVLVVAARTKPSDQVKPLGSIPWAELLKQLLAAITELIKTPAGMGVSLILLAVVLLIGEAAVNRDFTDSGTGTPPGSSAAPSTSASSGLPATSGSPSASPTVP